MRHSSLQTLLSQNHPGAQFESEVHVVWHAPSEPHTKWPQLVSAPKPVQLPIVTHLRDPPPGPHTWVPSGPTPAWHPQSVAPFGHVRGEGHDRDELHWRHKPLRSQLRIPPEIH